MNYIPNYFPNDICTRQDSVTHQYAYSLALPFVIAKLSNKSPDKKEIARTMLAILKKYIWENHRDRLDCTENIINHILIFENLIESNHTSLYHQSMSYYSSIENELDTIAVNLINKPVFPHSIQQEYLGYIQDLKQGLVETEQYFSGEINEVNCKLLKARIYDLSKKKSKEEAKFKISHGYTVNVSFNSSEDNESKFIVHFEIYNDKQLEVLKWLLLKKHRFINQVITQNNQPTQVLKPAWFFENIDKTVEAVYRILFNYFGNNPTHQLTDISLPQASENKSTCFIATAAYGNPMAAELVLLRRWRDESLMITSIGRVFVKFYTKISPPIAVMISGSEILRKITRVILHPIIRMLRIRKNADFISAK